MGTILNCTEQVFAIGRKNSWWLFDSALQTKECDEFLNLISKVHGFQLGFSSHPHIRSDGSESAFGPVEKVDGSNRRCPRQTRLSLLSSGKHACKFRHRLRTHR